MGQKTCLAIPASPASLKQAEVEGKREESSRPSAAPCPPHGPLLPFCHITSSNIPYREGSCDPQLDEPEVASHNLVLQLVLHHRPPRSRLPRSAPSLRPQTHVYFADVSKKLKFLEEHPWEAIFFLNSALLFWHYPRLIFISTMTCGHLWGSLLNVYVRLSPRK